MKFDDILNEEKETDLNEGLKEAAKKGLSLIPKRVKKAIAAGSGLLLAGAMVGSNPFILVPVSILTMLFFLKKGSLKKVIADKKIEILSKMEAAKKYIKISPSQKEALMKLFEKYPEEIYNVVLDLREKYSSDIAGTLKKFKNIDKEILNYIVSYKDEEGNDYKDFIKAAELKGFSDLNDFINTKAKAQAKLKRFKEIGPEAKSKYLQYKKNINEFQMLKKKMEDFSEIRNEFLSVPGIHDSLSKNIFQLRRENEEFNELMYKHEDFLDEIFRILNSRGLIDHKGLTEQRFPINEFLNILDMVEPDFIEEEIAANRRQIKKLEQRHELTKKEEASLSLSVEEFMEKVNDFYRNDYEKDAAEKLVKLLDNVNKDLIPRLKKEISREDWLELVIKPKLIDVFVNQEPINAMIDKLSIANKKLAKASGFTLKDLKEQANELATTIKSIRTKFRAANYAAGVVDDPERMPSEFEEYEDEIKKKKYRSAEGLYRDVERAKIILDTIEKQNVLLKSDVKEVPVYSVQLLTRGGSLENIVRAEKLFLDEEKAKEVVRLIKSKRKSETDPRKAADAVINRETGYVIASKVTAPNLNSPGVSEKEKEMGKIFFSIEKKKKDPFLEKQKAKVRRELTKEKGEKITADLINDIINDLDLEPESQDRESFRKKFGNALNKNDEDKIFKDAIDAENLLHGIQKQIKSTISQAKEALTTLGKYKIKQKEEKENVGEFNRAEDEEASEIEIEPEREEADY